MFQPISAFHLTYLRLTTWDVMYLSFKMEASNVLVICQRDRMCYTNVCIVISHFHYEMLGFRSNQNEGQLNSCTPSISEHPFWIHCVLSPKESLDHLG